MKTLDRLILAAIAVALSVIALNPWVAPGYVNAQYQPTEVIRGKVDVNIEKIDGRSITLPRVEGQLPGIPVIVLNVSDLRK